MQNINYSQTVFELSLQSSILETSHYFVIQKNKCGDLRRTLTSRPQK